MRESLELESKRYFVDYKIHVSMQVMVLKRIMQIKTLNKILALIRYLVEASDWYAVMNLFVAEILILISSSSSSRYCSS